MTPPDSGPPRRLRRMAGDGSGEGAPAGKAASAGSGAGGGITPGMAMVRQAVSFTNAQVLDPTANLSGTIKPTGMDVGANSLADSAGAMMLQDMRAYLQSTEMVLVPVTAAAFGKVLAGDPNGEKTLAQIEKMLGYLTAFSADVIANAASIQKDFG